MTTRDPYALAPRRPAAAKKAAAKKAAAKKAPAKPVAKKASAPISADHQADMETLMINLAAAAKRHGLCSTFQKELRAINKDLVVPLPIDKANATLKLRMYVDFPIGEDLAQYVTVDAYSSDQRLTVEGRTAAIRLVTEALKPLRPEVEVSSDGNRLR